jgi:hypothetical protein
MCKVTQAAVIAAAGVLFSAVSAWGQGCIVARSSEQTIGPESQGGYLQPGDFEVNIGYRHQFSYQHFVGPVEQSYRTQEGTQVENKINLEDFDLSYQINSRFSCTLSVPLLLASRRANNSYSTQTSQGIGDSTLVFQGWLFNPRKERARRGNLAIGYGVYMPTGRDNVSNNLASAPGATPVTTPVDYSIQPGQGGWGMVFQWQAFKTAGSSVFYTDGNYIATQGGYNNVLRSASALSQPLTAYNAIQDQYLIEAGVAHPVSRIKGLTLTFGPRDEGVPARDLMGDDLGFRRPGFAVSLSPGFIYVHGMSMFSFSVGKPIYRDRTRSVPDILLGTHGDAAFASWLWLASFTYRIPKHPPERESGNAVHSAAAK